MLARLVISCTAEYNQLTISKVYSDAQLGPNSFWATSKPRLHLNCTAVGMVQAYSNTRNWISIQNFTSELIDDCSPQRFHSKLTQTGIRHITL
jgi:hypothetical protein